MIIFSPGPSNITERVRTALLAPDVSHRDSEVRELLASVRRDLLRVAEVDPAEWAAVLFGGSGSLAIEACVSALRGRSVLVLCNGPYGERAAAMGRHHGALVHECAFEWGTPILPDSVEAAIEQVRPEFVHVVHHETATGRLNDLAELGALTARHGCRLLVDGVSSLAGETLRLDAWGVEAVLGSSNKCLRGVPGVAIVIARRRFLEEARKVPGVSYGHLGRHFEAEERDQTPFTPPVQALYALRAALDELMEEGVEARIRHYRRVCTRMREGLRSLGLDLLLPDGGTAHTMVACRLPDVVGYAALHAELKARGFVIYGAQGEFDGRVFRLGLVGAFGLPEVDAFLVALGDVLTLLRD